LQIIIYFLDMSYLVANIKLLSIFVNQNTSTINKFYLAK